MLFIDIMKKIAVIGDIHARKVWKDVDFSKYDNVVFIGDYFDSYQNISGDEQIINFNEIVKLKTDNPEKFILLFGNHELHYYANLKYNYSGYNSMYALQYKDVIRSAVTTGRIQAAYMIPDTNKPLVCTHAGISIDFLKRILNIPSNELEIEEIVNTLNEKLIFKPVVFDLAFDISGYGNVTHASPLWIRPQSLLVNALEGVDQIVGHTKLETITTLDVEKEKDSNRDDKITFIDVQDGIYNKNKWQYLEVIVNSGGEVELKTIDMVYTPEQQQNT